MIIKSYLNIYLEFIYEFIAVKNIVNSEIMAEFLCMNSHMKSWLKSFIWYQSGFTYFCFVEGYYILIQSNNALFFAASSLPALRAWGCWAAASANPRLLHCCTTATAEVCCFSQEGGDDVAGLSSTSQMSCISVKIWSACLSAIKGTIDTWDSRDYRRDQTQGHYPEGAIRSEASEGF